MNSRKEKGKDPPGILDWIQDQLDRIFDVPFKNLLKDFTRTAVEYDDKKYLSPVHESIAKQYEIFAKQKDEALRGKLEDLPAVMDRQVLTAHLASVGVLTSTIAASLVPFTSIGEAVDETWRMPSLITMNNISVDYLSTEYTDVIRPLLRRLRYRTYTPVLPGPADLVDIYAKRFLSDTDYKGAMAEQGLSNVWADRLRWAAETKPGVADLLVMLRRGVYTEDAFKNTMTRLKYHDVDINAYLTLREVIPGPSEIVDIYARHLLPDAEYKPAMAWHGIPGSWAERLRWAADVRPPVPDLMEMLWRNLIDEKVFTDIMHRLKYHDDDIKRYISLAEQIPPGADLVTMVVREAFVPEMVTPAPDVFAKYMAMKGFSKDWSDRYWTMHWLPMELRQAYENLWRGYWTKDQFMNLLKIADIHPMWREDIYNVAFRPPSIREMGYGYDVGEYSVEDIVRYRRWDGLAPEDAEKAGRAMVAYRTEAEREALRREALYDFTEGLDSEEELRANLEAIGGRPEIIDLWVSRAKFRAGRDALLEEVKFWRDAAIKGYVSLDSLEGQLSSLGVQRWKVEEVRKYVSLRRAKDPEVVQSLTEAQIGSLYRKYVVSHDYVYARFTRMNYPPEDAEMLCRYYVPLVDAKDIATYYVRGKISRAYAEARLKEIGLSEAEITAFFKEVSPVAG